MTLRFKMAPDLALRLEEIRQGIVKHQRRKALWGLAGATLAAVGLWVGVLEIFPGTGWLHLLAMMTGFGLVVHACVKVWNIWSQTISSEQIARYVDEHHPELQDRLTALVGLTADESASSFLLINRFLKESQETLQQHSFSPNLLRESKSLPLWPVWVLFILAGSLALWHLSKGATWWPRWAIPQAVASFKVEPGDTRARLGEDVAILVTFPEAHDRATRILWRGSGALWQETLMQAGNDARLRYFQFTQLQGALDYRVTDGEETSRTFKIQLWEPPEVESINLTYHYPDYLKLPSREVAFSGHITAVEGTRVTVAVEVNKPLKSAHLELESGSAIKLSEREPGVWTGEVLCLQTDAYRVALVDKEREANPVQVRYDIVVQPDKPPTVKIDFPRNDLEVSLLDEVAFDFKVSDDFGLRDFGLRYQVAGRDPEWVTLKPESFSGLEAQGHYQLMLEQMNLTPGDLVTWTVFAKDQKPDRPEFEEMAEPYFLEIRPFKREYREAVTQAGLQEGGPQSNLVQKQKDALIATWNLRKQADQLEDSKYSQDLGRIQKAQTEIQLEIEKSLGGEGGSGPSAELPGVVAEAVIHLTKATKPNPGPELTRAADAQQRAFQLLLKMMPNQAQVSRSRSQGGGGNSQQNEAMNELEMSRNRNFYEEEKLTQQKAEEAAAQTLDEIKDLARRQKMLNDEIAKLISEAEQEKDSESLKRRLERLQEELQKSLEQLDETQRNIRQSAMDEQAARQTEQQLDEARQDLQQAMDALEKERLQEARSASKKASNQLEKTSRSLGEKTRDTAEERMADLQKEFAEMQALQNSIEKAIAEHDSDARSRERLSGETEDGSSAQDLLEMKKELAQRYREAMERATKLAELTVGNQELLSRKMGDWLRETSRRGVGEAIEETSEMVRFGAWEGLEEKEKGIAKQLEQAGEKLGRVATMAVGDEIDAAEKTLQTLRQLRQDWESSAGEEPAQDMQRFAESEYRQWLDAMRDAGDLLPDDHRMQGRLNTIQREIEKVRKDFKREELTPQYELFLAQIAQPLAEVIDYLALDVARLREERNFVFVDDGSVPDRYRKRVADYFEALSHSERNPNP